MFELSELFELLAIIFGFIIVFAVNVIVVAKSEHWFECMQESMKKDAILYLLFTVTMVASTSIHIYFLYCLKTYWL